MFVLLLPGAALGAEEDRASPFSLELSAGLEYDTSVSIPEIDTATAKGDCTFGHGAWGVGRVVGRDSSRQGFG